MTPTATGSRSCPIEETKVGNNTRPTRYIGSIDLFSDSTDLLSDTTRRQALSGLYE
jgi:hypothetical protein